MMKMASAGFGRILWIGMLLSSGAWAEEPRNVRVEVLMVSMAQGKALALLPELRDPTKIDAAVGQIMAAISRKEATLTGLVMAVTPSGQKTISETVEEIRYPIEVRMGGCLALGGPLPLLAEKPHRRWAVPSCFEVRNTGTILEVEPVLGPDSHLMDLSISVQRCGLLGFDTYDSLKTFEGVSEIDQPRFCFFRTVTNLTLRSGQRCLLAIHKSAEGVLELFVVRATALE